MSQPKNNSATFTLDDLLTEQVNKTASKSSAQLSELVVGKKTRKGKRSASDKETIAVEGSAELPPTSPSTSPSISTSTSTPIEKTTKNQQATVASASASAVTSEAEVEQDKSSEDEGKTAEEILAEDLNDQENWALLGPPTLRDASSVRDPVDILVSYRDEKGRTIVTDKLLATLKKRFNSISEIATLPSIGELTKLSGIGDQTAVKIWKIAQQYHNLNARTAKTIISQQGSILKCSTGSSALDQLLGGGITTRAMTEFFGEAGMGKTQICYTAAVFALLPKQAGGFIDFDPASVDRPRVVWLDTEQTFNPNRIIEIVQNRFPKIQPDDILTNIIVYQVMSTDQLLLAVQEVFQNPDNVVLIILDSIMALYRFEYSHGVSELARRQQKLQEMIGIIKRNLVIRNTALLVTNQATTKMAMIGPMNLTTVEAAGGFAVAHAVTHRIKLTKKSAGKNKGLTIRKATIVDSPYLGSGEAEFILSPQGVLDFERTTTKVSKSKGSLAKEEFETEAEIEVEAEAEAEAETDEDISFE